MRRLLFFTATFVALVVAGTALPRFATRAHAASQTPTGTGNWKTGECGSDEGNTHNHWGRGDQERVCELRRTTFTPEGNHLAVSSMNGGIEVVGEDRSDIAVEARVQAWAGSESEAREILSQVRIDTSGDNIRDSGPRFHMSNKGYGINYRVHVPRKVNIDLHSLNGGIEIAHLDSSIRFDTTNGGVELNDLAGDVHGQTVNGGLEITLTGESWHGQGMHTDTTNGGVEIHMPEHYNAHLETGTVNGGIRVDFPVTVQGSIKNHLSTDIGSGGPLIHAETTNGGVEITHSGTDSARSSGPA